MGNLLNIVTPLHQKTKREYLPRMMDNKVEAMLKAKEYGFDYWDGDRRYGYGGYKYDGRQKVIADALIKQYNLHPNVKILDVGCASSGSIAVLKERLKRLPFNIQFHNFDLERVTDWFVCQKCDKVRKVVSSKRAARSLKKLANEIAADAINWSI